MNQFIDIKSLSIKYNQTGSHFLLSSGDNIIKLLYCYIIDSDFNRNTTKTNDSCLNVLEYETSEGKRYPISSGSADNNNGKLNLFKGIDEGFYLNPNETLHINFIKYDLKTNKKYPKGENTYNNYVVHIAYEEYFNRFN